MLPFFLACHWRFVEALTHAHTRRGTGVENRRPAYGWVDDVLVTKRPNERPNRGQEDEGGRGGGGHVYLFRAGGSSA